MHPSARRIPPFSPPASLHEPCTRLSFAGNSVRSICSPQALRSIEVGLLADPQSTSTTHGFGCCLFLDFSCSALGCWSIRWIGGLELKLQGGASGVPRWRKRLSSRHDTAVYPALERHLCNLRSTYVLAAGSNNYLGLLVRLHAPLVVMPPGRLRSGQQIDLLACAGVTPASARCEMRWVYSPSAPWCPCPCPCTIHGQRQCDGRTAWDRRIAPFSFGVADV